MTTINKQVSASSDDCDELNDATLRLTSTSIVVGYLEGGPSSYDIGLRWQSVAIPQAATISSAKLSLYLVTDIGTIGANIRGIAEDNTATWSSGSRPSQRSKTGTVTANEANWNNWGTGGWIDIDITTIVQAIVNRVGWSSNNALAVVIENTASSGTHEIIVRSQEYSGNAHGAKLDIVFVGRASKNTRSSMNVHPGVLFQTLTSGHGY